ncbi:MAG: hypothetical protein U9P14_04565 [Gemmatimonadota bacterium]|nr:hypothetical protein [Gemmatimonadota bacterium]
MDETVIMRWHARLEKGLLLLLERPFTATQKGRFSKALESLQKMGDFKSPASRLLNSLGELGLGLGFHILSMLLFRKSETADPGFPVPRLNLSRAEMNLAGKFLLKAPASGAVAHNLRQADTRLEGLLKSNVLPKTRQVEARVLKNRIEDRLLLWQDVRQGRMDSSEIEYILLRESESVRPTLAKKIPSIEKLEKFEPESVGFYYRQYREEQEKKKRS